MLRSSSTTRIDFTAASLGVPRRASDAQRKRRVRATRIRPALDFGRRVNSAAEAPPPCRPKSRWFRSCEIIAIKPRLARTPSITKRPSLNTRISLKGRFHVIRLARLIASLTSSMASMGASRASVELAAGGDARRNDNGLRALANQIIDSGLPGDSSA